NGIEHGWEQHECKNDKIREITIQFSRNLFGEVFLAKTQLASIRKMLDQSANGIAFSLPSIMRVYSRLDRLTATESGFYRVIELMSILYELADERYYRTLSSTSFSSIKPTGDSRRVQKVQEYIEHHYKEAIRLSDLAEIARMTPTAFSRFFKLRTGRSISDYLIDIRLGHATRALVDSTTSIAEICYECGFNNISNFNRIFKKKKGSSPKVFRDLYQHHKTVV
ncbi:MAG: AraC family transcriptional regulator, partial [Duncaniella sp.]|nr:AraC family transcriptional regulator [Duncaniella sp.]